MNKLINSDTIRSRKWWTDLLVMLLIVMLFFLPSIMFDIAFNKTNNNPEHTLGFYVMPTIYVFVFLFNYYYLVGKTILSHKNFWWFLGMNLVLVVVVSLLAQLLISFIHSQMASPPPAPRHPHHHHDMDDGFEFIFKLNALLRDGVMMLLSAGFALAFKLSTHSADMHRKELEINAERKQMEIQSLKAQLNPHFLFNTFNNIYSLISFAPDKAQKAVHDLSSMLRFMIYDSASPFVPLEKELMFVTDYIELMKLRLNTSMQLRVAINREGVANYEIAPLLFLTIIENAFKHGTTGLPGAFIDIDIHMAGDEVICRVGNSCKASTVTVSDQPHGVGLDNIRKQLNLLYPNNHELEIIPEETQYTVNLKIKINKINL